ncbi:hypothetical protein [Streptomyces formicae]|uniref:Uncharacterized protein n=1 Tax=Streptomyces formicae TaxID=1616117 RepID=A0ABY3WL02_9ACTN|nr:hypothetical protein [Streptomyces formicae]UNM11457.1 hypothetical protein J4032_07835 [Streptomyces formicae]
MFAYELHQVMQAELIRRADAERLLREARQARRSARLSARRSAENDPEGRVSTRSRFARAA